MLPHTLRPSLQRSSLLQEACNVCSCRCGAQFSSRRSYTSSTPLRRARRAPSTKERINRSDPIPLTGAYAQDARKYKDALDGWKKEANAIRSAKLNKAYMDGLFNMTASEVDEFLEEFAQLYGSKRWRIGSSPEGFSALVERYDVTERDLVYIAIMLIQNKKIEQDLYWGNKLIFALSAEGYIEACIRILSNALNNNKQRPGTLKSADVAIERGRLQKLAREGNHSRAMVLEGKIAYELGDAETALKWWWQSIEGAVADSERRLARTTAGQEPGDFSGLDLTDLSTPWIDLIEAHFERSLIKGKNEWEQCEKAIEIGVKQDDPTAFYYAATYNKKRNEDGTHLPTSEWLYNMTKAAASGVPKAAYELGIYYAESGWKYIEDEPPEELKPTPFDSYPGKNVSQSPWDRVRRLFSISKVQPRDDKSNIFHSASWPSTPEHRYEVAMRWFSVSTKHTYAPAYLYMAKLFMQETLWAGAQAPQEALSLDPKRYWYASREEEADAHFTGDVKTHELPEGVQDPPNKNYSIESAKLCLLQVFMARQAVKTREALLRRHARDQILEFEDIYIDRNENNYNMYKYYDNPEVYDQWEKESLAMYNEAAAICDEMQWSIYDDRGALVYKAAAGAVA